mgnify:CR=1 FL=1
MPIITDKRKEEENLQNYILAIDDFIKEYVKWARRFQLFRDEYHKLIAATLIGHATRNWRNQFTGSRGNRLFVMIFGETNSGKTRLGYEIPYFSLTRGDNNPLNIVVMDEFTGEGIAEYLNHATGPPLIIIEEAAMAFAKEYAAGAVSIINAMYDGRPYQRIIKSSPVRLKREHMRASIIAITTLSKFEEVIGSGMLGADPIASGFLPRFITVLVPRWTLDQWSTTISQTTNDIEYNHELAMFLKALESVANGEVIYSDEARARLVEIAMSDFAIEEENEMFRRRTHHVAALAADIAIARTKATPTVVYYEHVEEAEKLLKAIYEPCARELVRIVKSGVTEYDRRLMRAVERVAEYIIARGVVRRRDIIRNLGIPAKRLDEIEQNLKELDIQIVQIGRARAYCAKDDCEDCPFKEKCHKVIR